MSCTWRLPWGLLLRVATLTLVGFCDCEGSFSHSLQYFYTGVSEPGQGLPRFTEIGYVDGQLFVHYDSNTRKTLPRVSWIKEADKEDPQYWDRNTQNAQAAEVAFRDNVHIAMHRYNHTGGLHFVQETCGCELREDGSKGGHWQFAYDGRDFLTFDKETLTWTAADAQAQVTKRKWDTGKADNWYRKTYLEETCIEWLQKYVHYGEKSLMKKECPEMKVTSRADFDNMETLICRADGFYPKDIHAVWTRDGEVWEQETLRGLVAPNSDGTYHTWISTKINPKDKDRFRCLVDHVSWKDPVDFAVEERAPAFNLWPTVGYVILGVLLFGAVITAGFLLYQRRRQNRYNAAPMSPVVEA